MTHVSLRLALLVGTAIGVSWSAAVLAATPVEIRVETALIPVVITDPADADRLMGDLCTDEAAVIKHGRPSLSFAVTWTDDLVWVGRFYPSMAGEPAAVDIPDWVLYPGPRRCDERVAGEASVGILAAHGVPVVRAPATDASHGTSTWGWLIPIVAGVAGVLAWTRASRTR